MGATNLPYELDEAIIRRFEKRIFVPLPNPQARQALVEKLISLQPSRLSARDVGRIVAATEGFSGSDLHHLCKEAALGPIRELDANTLKHAQAADIRTLELKDFESSLRRIRPSVKPETLQRLHGWNRQYGVAG